MQCSACQFENPEQMRFCGQCGTALATTCTHCAEQLLPGFKFCGKCGQPVETPQAKPLPTPSDEPPRHATILTWSFNGPDDTSFQAFDEHLQQSFTNLRGYTHPSCDNTALFGYPVNHENDSQRAVHAAQQAVAFVKRHPETQVKFVIHTGLVVVEAGGGLSGDSLLLAKTGLQFASGNEVLVSNATAQLVDRFFDLTALQADTQLEFHRVLGTSSPGAPRYRSELTKRTPFVGRAAELTAIEARLAQTAQHEGQVIQICGEPGMGKSRLVGELYERRTKFATTCLWHTVSCLELNQNSAFADILEVLGTIDKQSPDPLSAALLEQLQGKPVEPSVFADQSQKQLRERTFEVLSERFFDNTGDALSVLVVEDVHWADPSTVEFVRWLVPRIASLNCALILTFRPEFAPSWPHAANLLELYLEPLRAEDATKIVEHLTSEQGLRADQLQKLLERTDGVPFFVEELTRMFAHDPQVTNAALSETLHELLGARLDQFGDGKRVLQTASVLGRTFTYEMLRQIWHHSEDELAQCIVQLIGEHVLEQEHRHGVIHFRHALLQEAAYNSLGDETKARLHLLVADAMRQQSASGGGGNLARPELIASHLIRANHPKDALPYLLRAGDQATEAASYDEGEANYRRGLSLLADMPRDEAIEMRFEGGLGHLAAVARGFGDPEVGRAYGRLALLAERQGRPDSQLLAMNRLVFHHTTVGRHEAALDAALSAETIAAAGQNPRWLTQAKVATILPHWHLGQNQAAHRAAEEALAMVAQQSDQRLKDNIAFWVANYATQTYWVLGEFQAAMQALDEGERFAREALDPYRLAQYLSYGSTTYIYLQQNIDRFKSNLVEARKIATEHGFDVVRIWSELYLGWVSHHEGEHERAVSQLSEAIAATLAYRSRFAMPLAHILLAQAQLDCGDAVQAKQALNTALHFQQAHTERSHHAEILRVQALVEHHQGRDETAVQLLDQAIEVAQSQRGVAWQIRALTTKLEICGSDAETKQRLSQRLVGYPPISQLPDVQAAYAAVGGGI